VGEEGEFFEGEAGDGVAGQKRDRPTESYGAVNGGTADEFVLAVGVFQECGVAETGEEVTEV